MNQTLNLTKEEFDAAVEQAVEAKLSSKEEAQARQEAEEALTEAKETFESLKAALETRDAKIKEYEEALANLDVSEPTAAEVAANEKVVELEKELDEWKQAANVAQAALDTIAREETAASRMSELEEAGIVLDGEAAESQYAKVRDMSNEEFDSYKGELAALKAKFGPASEEVEEEKEVAELSSEEVGAIAQSLGCDPADSKCVSLVQEVAKKVSEVSAGRIETKSEKSEEETKEENASGEENSTEEPNKEVAAVKLSPGEAVAKAMNQEIQAPAALRDQISQEWENLYAAKRGENEKSE